MTPPRQMWPILHKFYGNVIPSSLQEYPGGHRTGRNSPSTGQTLPKVHTVQFYYPKCILKVPLGHLIGATLPFPGQKYLGGQGIPECRGVGQ